MIGGLCSLSQGKDGVRCRKLLYLNPPAVRLDCHSQPVYNDEANIAVQFGLLDLL